MRFILQMRPLVSGWQTVTNLAILGENQAITGI
jgi:hypothetical protein